MQAIAPPRSFVYRAYFVNLVDGDTFDLRLSFGKFGGVKCEATVRLRVRNFNADELGQDGGQQAADLARHILSTASEITVQTFGPSFERTLCDVWVDGEPFPALMVKSIR